MKRIFSYIPLIGIMMLYNCSDDISNIGGSTQPNDDKMKLFIDSAYVNVESVGVDKIYAKTSTPLLGAFQDDTFGYVLADFMTEFYCAENFSLHENWYKETNPKIDSAFVRLYYKNFEGDSRTPHEATVYRLQKKLDKNYYTDVKPDEYYRPSGASPIVLGRTTYTGINYSVSDSIRKLKDYTSSVRIRLENSFVEEFKNKLIQSPATFKDSKAFREWFKGIYVQNSKGRGTLLNITAVDMVYHFNYHVKTSNGAKDSLVHGGRLMPMTREVIQLNNYDSNDITDEESGPQYAYIKAPGGIFATMEMPLRSIIEKHRNEIVNRISYSFKVSKIKNSTLPYPKHMLLISKEEYDKEFFEKGLLPSSTTSSFVTAYDSVNYVYSFSNIGALLSNQMEKYNTTLDLKQIPDSITSYLIPITVSSVTNASGIETIDKISHYFIPAAVRIKKNKFPVPSNPNIPFGHKLDMIFSKYATK